MALVGRIKLIGNFANSYLSDSRRFWEHSQMGRPFKNQHTAQGHLFRLCHALEKGAALPVPKPGFGHDKMLQISDWTRRYCESWGVDPTSRMAFAVVYRTLAFHRGRGADFVDVQERLNQLLVAFPALGETDSVVAGTRHLTRDEVLASLPASPEAFFYNRTSVRQFGPRSDFDPSSIERAVSLAQRAPSVCNRQGGRAHVFTEPEAIRRLLKHQDGNVGFGDTASALVVVTADLSGFYKVGERNQGYVDGGLFAMALVYAFHGIGVGSCMLNWSQPAHKDADLRKVLDVSDREVIITMIAVGPLREEFDVAVSPRLPLGDVLFLNKNLRN